MVIDEDDKTNLLNAKSTKSDSELSTSIEEVKTEDQTNPEDGAPADKSEPNLSPEGVEMQAPSVQS